MLARREHTGLYLAVIGAERLAHGLAHLGEMLGEFGLEVRNAEHILPDQHLRVALGRSADTDGDDVELFRDERGEFRRHAFERYRESACLLYRERVLEHAACVRLTLALHGKAAKGVDRLRCHADMRDDRNACGRDGADLGADLFSALELDRARAGLLHDAACILHRLLDRDLIAHERHIDHNERVLAAAHDAAAVNDHLIDRYRKRVLVALHGHAEAVADQDHVDSRRVDQLRGRVVITGQLRDLLAVPLHRGKSCYCVFHFCPSSVSSRNAP